MLLAETSCQLQVLSRVEEPQQIPSIPAKALSIWGRRMSLVLSQNLREAQCRHRFTKVPVNRSQVEKGVCVCLLRVPLSILVQRKANKRKSTFHAVLLYKLAKLRGLCDGSHMDRAVTFEPTVLARPPPPRATSEEKTIPEWKWEARPIPNSRPGLPTFFGLDTFSGKLVNNKCQNF